MGIGHVFPGYTLPVIHGLDYETWVVLAITYDEHVAELKKQRGRKR